MYDEAEKVLREAIGVIPDHAHFYYSLGVVMGRVNKLKVNVILRMHTGTNYTHVHIILYTHIATYLYT